MIVLDAVVVKSTMTEPDLEDIVNPKLAQYLREKKTRKQVDCSETKTDIEETESQEPLSEDENFIPEEEHTCCQKIPLKVCFPRDRTVQNTIKLVKHQRKIEEMIREVKKEIRAQKGRKAGVAMSIKTENLPGSATAPEFPLNEDSDDSLWVEAAEYGVQAVSDAEEYGNEDHDEDNSVDELTSEEDEKAKSRDRSVTDVHMWPPCPPLPKLKKVKIKAKSCYPFQDVPKYGSRFSLGRGYKSLNLGHKNVIKLLRKGIAVLLLHYGWQETSRETLDVLTDFAEEFFLKLTRLLRTAVDHQLETGTTGFPDVLERVLVEMGLGGIEGIVQDYQLRVLNYNNFVLGNCLRVMEEYKMLTQTRQKDIISELVCKIEDEDGDVPEIHFPALGEGYAVDELQPSLEPGFQMLHSLEQEEQLQNLEAEEEMTIGDSLSQESQLSSYSASGGTPRSKKKRKK
ncbi:uncharacterized protein LOC126234258 isoform X1 [Schistocerca nitens]|uniref:uncharacterized protein LOC126234258 isoform X1 n=1 Tax=Schistocerca nitens TaxID=7011 RepID=UPI0021185C1A|nr:uncharacterized protein LOC126234258 isoform X1 [Schistocerca nitens]